jgi:hypothetical protein
LQADRENFIKYRDANGDGKMDRDEVSNWILPTDYDHTLAEAKHLIYEADSDKVSEAKHVKEKTDHTTGIF